MKHDIELKATAYLSGEMSSRARYAFEGHILECDDCWTELEQARAGRSFAERGRELAPQRVRELVRASVASVSPKPTLRPPRLAGLIAVAVALLVIVGVAGLNSLRSDQPPRIVALLDGFQGESSIGRATAPSLPRRLGDLRLNATETGKVRGLPW